MKLEEAIKILETVSAQFKGNLQEHQTIQQALQAVKDALKPKEDVPQQS